MPTGFFFFLHDVRDCILARHAGIRMGIHSRQNSNLMYLDLYNHFKHSSLQFKFAIIELEIGIHNNCKL